VAYASLGKHGTNIPFFENVLRNLSKNPDKYGFKKTDEVQNILKEIQEAYGFMVNDNFDIVDEHGVIVTDQTYVDAGGNVIYSDRGIKPDMLKWWQNFRNSRNVNSLAYKLINLYHTNIANLLEELRKKGLQTTLDPHLLK